MKLSREQALAFRLASHHLDRRRPPADLLPVVGACGIQNSPPGSALLALHARLAEVTPARLASALETDKTLLQMWSLRQSPYIFPTQDAALFTSGLVPLDEPALRYFIRGAWELLDKLGWSAGELVERTRPGLRLLLDGPSLPFRTLSTQLTDWLAGNLSPAELSIWQSPSGFAPGQRLGEALVHFALRPLSLAGEFCFGPRIGAEAGFVRLDHWLGDWLPEADPLQAGQELARRYLRCYGPSRPRHFAEWSGIAPHQVDQVWSALQGELAEVDLEGRRSWLLAADLERLPDGLPQGVRLLPPDDPLLALRDREMFVPQTERHALIWRALGRPGVLLIDGQAAATWRAQKTGRRLQVTVTGFDHLAPQTRARIEAEAATLAPLRDCTTLQIVFNDSDDSSVNRR